MRRRPDSGSVLAADLALSGVLVLVLASVITTTIEITERTHEVQDAAWIASLQAARTGAVSGGDRDVSIEVSIGSESATATARARADVTRPFQRPESLLLSHTEVTPIAPFRSNR